MILLSSWNNSVANGAQTLFVRQFVPPDRTTVHSVPFEHQAHANNGPRERRSEGRICLGRAGTCFAVGTGRNATKRDTSRRRCIRPFCSSVSDVVSWARRRRTDGNARFALLLLERAIASNECMFLRALGLFGLLVFFASGFTPITHLLDRWLSVRPDLAPADAIVVLADYVSEWGMLSDASARRTHHAIELYRKGFAPLIVFSGDGPDDDPSEGKVRAGVAMAKGVPARAILMAGGATTREEALREWALLQPRGARNILLVTDSLHMRRAHAVFERVGFTVHAAPPASPGDPGTPEARLKGMGMIVEQLLALCYYWVAGYI